MGFFGELLGFLVGRCLAHNYKEPMSQIRTGWIFSFVLFGLAVLGAVVIAVAASWIPAMHAARLDPAITLREE